MKLVRKTELSSDSRLSEQEYRDIKQALNYSALRVYVSSRYRFYKEFILGEPREDDQSAESVIGSIAHVILAAKEGEFDNKYTIASVQEPKGQMLKLVQNLYRISVRELTEDGRDIRQFEERFKDAVQETKYDRDLKVIAFSGKELPKILEMFHETDKEGCCPSLYYSELMANTDKTVVTIGQITAAERAVEMLKNHPFTQELVNLQSHDHVEVFSELPIIWAYQDIPCKSLIDKMIINHDNQTVTIVDWKFTWDEQFNISYLKNRYYLQVGMYNTAVFHWLGEHEMGHYTLNPMQYVICDPAGNTAPLIYQLTNEDIMNAMNGFTIRNYKYPGVVEVLKNIQYHQEHSVWNCSVEAHKNNGKLPLLIQYDTI